MRTTVTLDPDVAELLRQATHQTGQTFKEVLNNGLRRSLAGSIHGVTATPFVVRARPMRLRAGSDPARLHDLAGDIEAEAFLSSTRRLVQKSRQ